MKSNILVLLACIITFTTNSQTIKDYYLPEASYNKVNFYTPSKTGGRSGMTRVIYYINKVDNYDILDSHMFNDQPSSIITRTVKFSTNEVQMIKSVSTTIFETNTKQEFNPPRIILKMPPSGQTISWSYLSLAGDNIKCISSWTTVSVNGTQKKAIKKVETNELGKTIEYYVKGIGLWKTEISADGGTQPFDEFDGLGYE